MIQCVSTQPLIQVFGHNSPSLKWVFCALLVLLLLAGCGKSRVDPLADTQWALVSLNGQDIIEGSRITLNFAEGSVGGSAGCNTYTAMTTGPGTRGATYTLKTDGTLTLPSFMITEMGCMTPAGVLQQEQAYMNALHDAATYQIAGNRLEIGNATGVTLVFDRE